MANRNFASGGKIYSMHVMPVLVDCEITIGASGAVASFKGSLVSSVTKESTGVYKIHLAQTYNRLFTAVGSMSSPSVGASGIASVELANAQINAVANSSDPSITIKTLDVTNAVANPASGSTVNVIALISNSSVILPNE